MKDRIVSMPHPIIHLGMSLGTGYILTGGAKRGAKDWKLIISFSLLVGLMDVDLLIRSGSGIRYLHNLNVAFNIPIAIFIFASFARPSAISTLAKRAGLLTASMGLGHLALDMWGGGVYHFMYPLSTNPISITTATISHNIMGTGLGAGEMTLVIWGVVLVLGKIFYDFIELDYTDKRYSIIQDLEVLGAEDMAFPEEAYEWYYDPILPLARTDLPSAWG